MSDKSVINTNNAPKAIGPYSQAIKVNQTIYLSGQIPLHPQTMELVTGDITAQAGQVFDNIKAVAEAAGGKLADIVKINIFLTDLNHFADVNKIMALYFDEPYPARACVGVAQLPKNSAIEIDAIMVL